MSKKKWRKPKLVVLVKGSNQEAVLEGCKVVMGSPYGPGSKWSSCGNQDIYEECVEPCSSLSIAGS